MNKSKYKGKIIGNIMKQNIDKGHSIYYYMIIDEYSNIQIKSLVKKTTNRIKGELIYETKGSIYMCPQFL